jgi:hypothetical protein
VKEIHGYRPELGLRIFRDEALTATKKNITVIEAASGIPIESGKKRAKTIVALKD